MNKTVLVTGACINTGVQSVKFQLGRYGFRFFVKFKLKIFYIRNVWCAQKFK